ncbi:hypothetical protein NC651_023468 [Populus alba x Populus x berolinensis]|nr:hypothetical protein NC651_023468 [Populus alba x Populus x berolinensis]
MYKTSVEKHGLFHLNAAQFLGGCFAAPNWKGSNSAKYTLSAPPHLTGCLVAVRCNEEHLRLPSGCHTTSLGRDHSIRFKTCLLPKHLQGEEKEMKIVQF